MCAGAPLNNQNALKFKNSNIKKEAYDQYCEWIKSGKPKEAWTFIHPEFSCTYKTIEKYIKEDPIEFPSIKKELAECASYDHWFELGKDMMTGKIEKCQPAIYQMIMRNKFGWDKEDKKESSTQPLVVKLVNDIRNE